MEFNKPYFTTSTINGWKRLLKPDKYKDIITGSLKFLADKDLIKVYAFVIMPNHIHLIWELLKMNRKEKPDALVSSESPERDSDVWRRVPFRRLCEDRKT